MVFAWLDRGLRGFGFVGGVVPSKRGSKIRIPAIASAAVAG
jgi:hypothetical protein